MNQVAPLQTLLLSLPQKKIAGFEPSCTLADTTFESPPKKIAKFEPSCTLADITFESPPNELIEFHPSFNYSDMSPDTKFSQFNSSCSFADTDGLSTQSLYKPQFDYGCSFDIYSIIFL